MEHEMRKDIDRVKNFGKFISQLPTHGRADGVGLQHI